MKTMIFFVVIMIVIMCAINLFGEDIRVIISNNSESNIHQEFKFKVYEQYLTFEEDYISDGPISSTSYISKFAKDYSIPRAKALWIWVESNNKISTIGFRIMSIDLLSSEEPNIKRGSYAISASFASSEENSRISNKIFILGN